MLFSQQTGVALQPPLPAPMTEMGEQSRPMRPVRGPMTPRSPRRAPRPPELDYEETLAFRQRFSNHHLSTYGLKGVAALHRASVTVAGRASGCGGGSSGDHRGWIICRWKRGRDGRRSHKYDEEEEGGDDGLSRARKHRVG